MELIKKGVKKMPISAESVQKLFIEQVKRPIDPALAEQVVNLLSPFIDGLNTIEVPMDVQPSIVFQPIER